MNGEREDPRVAPPDPAARVGSPAPSQTPGAQSTTADRPGKKSRRRQARAGEGGDEADHLGERVDPRVQRTVRLSREIDAMIRALAQHRGIDLNAAISVAIAGDYDRVFGPPPRPPELVRERDEPASATTSPHRDR